MRFCRKSQNKVSTIKVLRYSIFVEPLPRWQNWYEWLPGPNFKFLFGGQHFHQHKYNIIGESGIVCGFQYRLS